MLSGLHRSGSPRRFASIVRFTVFVAGLLAGMAPAVALTVEQIESPKGIKAWLVEEHSVPLIALKFAFGGGAVQDPADKEGLASMMSDLLTEGAGDKLAAAFKEELSRLGARLSMSSGRDAVYGSLETLSKNFTPSIALLRLALTAPRFDADAIELNRAQRLTDLALAANEPSTIALDRWYAEAFPGNIYGRPINGTPESIRRLTRDDIKGQHARLFAKDVLKVVMVGDIDKRAAAEALDATFSGLLEKAQLMPLARSEPRTLQAPIVVNRDQPLATAAFGLPSLRTDSPDFPAMQVLNHVIGSGDFDSRLMEEIRVKRGLAYSVKTSLLSDTISALMIGGVSTQNENMGTALAVMRDVLSTTARDGPTSAQFENAKRYLTGSFLLDFDTNGKVAGSLLGIWLDGQGPDYLLARNQKIARVTLADVKRVAGEVLKTDRLVITIVGKPKLVP